MTRRTGKSPGTLRGQRIAFAGRLASMTQKQAARIAERGGAEVVAVITTRTVLVLGLRGWPLTPAGEPSPKLCRAVELNAQRADVRISSEADFLKMAGMDARLLDQSVSPDVLARMLDVSLSDIEEWERLQLCAARDGHFELRAIYSLQLLAGLLLHGAKAARIVTSLIDLSHWLPGTEDALNQVQRLVTAPRAVLQTLANVAPAAGGQLHLGLGLEADEPQIIQFRMRAPEEDVVLSAADWFGLAQSLEEEDRLEEAADAYRRSIAGEPGCAEAFFNLGTIHQTTGHAEAAIEVYRLAVALDPKLACAWYNLADLQEAAGNTPAAIDSLRAALRADGDYADAHYNLALLLEQRGRKREAAQHWAHYLRLDPDSRWSAAARQRLGQN